MNKPQKPALMRPKPRPQGERASKASPPSREKEPVASKPTVTAPVKSSVSAPSKPQKVPKPRKVEPILEHDGLKAGDEIWLPYSGQTVAITQFYKTISDAWYVAFEGGCAHQEAVTVLGKDEE
ncbi:MAG: hypothetical protein J7647_16345 [Cyanobacteria bacterium SBLK]|nr:hypothetical protein [Cyanobacteria bacterium SBLK]